MATNQEDLVKEEFLDSYSSLLAALGNKTRLSMVVLLREKPRRWTEFMTLLKIRNKRNLFFHLNKLKKHGIIEQKKDRTWHLTGGGEAFFKLSLSQALDIVSQIIEAGPERDANSTK